MSSIRSILTRAPLCYYYSSQKSQCVQEIISSYLHRLGPGQLPSEQNVINQIDSSLIPCMLVPHGAYCDSEPLYAQAYYWLNSFMFDTALIIGTNHCGAGMSNVSLSPDHWQTPLGIGETDTDLLDSLVLVLGPQTIDREAHRKEHSIENQLPFLKHLRPKTKFVALSFSRLKDLNQGYQVCEQIKQAINLYRQQTGKRIVIIATTDYTHYGPGYGQIRAENLSENVEYARRQDKPILQCILSNNPEQLLQTQRSTQNSMCGLWPSLIVMILSKILNANQGQWNLLCYHVSSEVMERGKDVCGFASLVFSNISGYLTFSPNASLISIKSWNKAKILLSINLPNRGVDIASYLISLIASCLSNTLASTQQEQRRRGGGGGRHTPSIIVTANWC